MAYTIACADTKSKEILWQDSFDDIEMVAGMMAASVGLVGDLNRKSTYSTYSVDTDADITYYRALTNVIEEEINMRSCGILVQGEYGVWIQGNFPGRYDLYRFTRATFFQGYISMCTAYRTDFRNYMYGIIFDSNMKKHVLANYIFNPYQIAVDVPDLNDVDDEEKDDENIIEPLRKDW